MTDKTMYCPKCEYEIRGAKTGQCPLCDEPLVPSPWRGPDGEEAGFQEELDIDEVVSDVKHRLDKTESAAAGGESPEAACSPWSRWAASSTD